MTEVQRSRRGALTTLLRWLAAAGALPLDACAAGLFGRGESRLRVATLAQVPPGGALRTVYRDQPVIVVNAGGAVRAFAGWCTHEACELGWNARQQLIRCPCHGSAFDTAGQVVLGPATIPLPELVTRVERDAIYILGRKVVPGA